MAEDRYDNRELWGEDRRRELQRRRQQEDGYSGEYAGDRRFEDAADKPGYRPFGETGRIYAPSGHEGGGRAYRGSRRFDELTPAYRDFEATQGRRHHGDDERGAYAPNPRTAGGPEPRSWWDRTQDELSALFGDEQARRRREWDHRVDETEAQHRGKGPKAYRRSDARIAEDINDKLTEDAYLDASDIEVSVVDGEATLTWTIARREDKRRAEDIADRVSGVSHVQNNLRLRRADGPSVATPPLI
jgi:hypothetical protein